MAIVGSTNLTLQDVASRTQDRKVMSIAEILTQYNMILMDMVWKEGNLPTGHKHGIRAGLPAGTWRKLYGGVPNEKSKVVNVTDTCGMLESYSEVDKSLATINNNAAAVRADEAKAFLQGLSDTMASTIFYGNTATDPEKFMGLAPRYNSTTGENSANILTGDGTGSDNTSIWLVTWSEDATFGIYPRGSKAGLQHEDLGEVTLTDSNSNKYQGYRDHFKWDAGLAVKNWKYNVRICNIDVSNLTKNAATGSDLIDLMAQSMHLTPPNGSGKKVFYANNTVLSYLDRQTMNRSNLSLGYEEVHGQVVNTFRKIPIMRCDALLNTETLVS